ncbi:MAG: response regulator [Paracoccus sp. (in: a-proteobacteria)]|uniref:response regulator n=1 Tax=Paracoccus sp. TaxID=267 RepID=UPI00391BC96A
MTSQAAKRVLIVEDEALLALHLEDMLSELGHEVVGQAGRFDAAMQLARDGDFDFAILDVNVSGTKSFPIADILHERGIPFAFATGYGADGLSEKYRAFPILQKPYAQHDLERTIEQVCSGSPQ